MFDSSFRYGVSSFPHADTSSRVVVFRIRLVKLPVRLGVLGSRLIASWVLLVILSVRLVVLRVRPITDHIGSSSFVFLPFRRFVMAFHRFVMSFRRFDSSTQRGYNSTYITWCVFHFPAVLVLSMWDPKPTRWDGGVAGNFGKRDQ